LDALAWLVVLIVVLVIVSALFLLGRTRQRRGGIIAGKDER